MNIINPKAKIDENVKIDSFSIIHEDVEIGKNSWIGSNVTIFPGARIGKNCKIYQDQLFPLTSGFKYNNENTRVIIGIIQLSEICYYK